MPSDHNAASDAPMETLRRHFARVARSHELGAWDERETLNGLSDAAIAAVAGERAWAGQALSPDQVAEAMVCLSDELRSRLHQHLLNRDAAYWSQVRIAPPAGGPPIRYTQAFLHAAERLRGHLRRVRGPA